MVQKDSMKRKANVGLHLTVVPHRDCSLNKKRRVVVPDTLHDNVAPSESSDSDIHPVVGLFLYSSADESGDEWLPDDN